MLKKSVILLILLSLIITSGCMVIDIKQNSAGVPDVKVTIEKPDGTVTTRQTSSDSEPNVNPGLLPIFLPGNGTYKITPEKDGFIFDPTQQTVDYSMSDNPIMRVEFEATQTAMAIDDVYETIVIPALKKAQMAMYEVDDCPRMCDDCYYDNGGTRWCFDETWPKTIPDEYGNGSIRWNVTSRSYVTYNNYKVSVNGYTVVLNGSTYVSLNSSYDGYMKNGSSYSNHDPITITGNFPGGTASITSMRINFDCRQPTDGSMTISYNNNSLTRNIALDTRYGHYEYGFFEGMKPCAISCKWTNKNCTDTDDQDQVWYCKCKNDNDQNACNQICSKFPGLPQCN